MTKDPEEQYIKDLMAKEFGVKGWCEICGSGLDNQDSDAVHTLCEKIMNGETSHEVLPTTMGMGYYKQGDDFAGNIVKDKYGTIDLYMTLSEYKNQMEGVVERIQDFIDAISELRKKYPDAEKNLFIQADTHMIGFNGPREPMLELIKRGVVSLDYGVHEMIDDEENDDWDDDFYED